MKDILRHWQVVILRPTHQAQSLMEAVKAHGGEPYLLPLIEIQPLTLNEASLAKAEMAVEQSSYLIVTSANAIWCAPDAMINMLRTQEKLMIVTMGKATTQALNEKGLSVFFTAPPGSTSESLLEQPFLREEAVRGQNILLLAGEGGRTLLAQTLQARGAKISWLKTYQVQEKSIDMAPALQAWQHNKHVCFVATSSRILECLHQLTPVVYLSWLQNAPLIVVSERIAARAKQLGVKQLFVAKSPHTKEIVITLQEAVQFCSMK